MVRCPIDVDGTIPGLIRRHFLEGVSGQLVAETQHLVRVVHRVACSSSDVSKVRDNLGRQPVPRQTVFRSVCWHESDSGRGRITGRGRYRRMSKRVKLPTGTGPGVRSFRDAMTSTGPNRELRLRSSAEALRLEMEELALRLKELALSQPPEQLLGHLWSCLMMNSLRNAEPATQRDSKDDNPRNPLQVLLEYVH